jgi:hypothetical protein
MTSFIQALPSQGSKHLPQLENGRLSNSFPPHLPPSLCENPRGAPSAITGANAAKDAAFTCPVRSLDRLPHGAVVFGDRNFDTAVVRRGTGAADAALPTVRETRVFSLLLEAAHVSAREE